MKRLTRSVALAEPAKEVARNVIVDRKFSEEKLCRMAMEHLQLRREHPEWSLWDMAYEIQRRLDLRDFTPRQVHDRLSNNGKRDRRGTAPWARNGGRNDTA